MHLHRMQLATMLTKDGENLLPTALQEINLPFIAALSVKVNLVIIWVTVIQTTGGSFCTGLFFTILQYCSYRTHGV